MTQTKAPARSAPPTGVGSLPVSKKVAAGKAGTVRYQRQFGDALVCVRYRTDPTHAKRYTTVELVVDERALPNLLIAKGVTQSERVAVPIHFTETELRQRVKDAGAQWDSDRKAWLMPYQTAMELGLHGRVKKINQGDGS